MKHSAASGGRPRASGWPPRPRRPGVRSPVGAIRYLLPNLLTGASFLLGLAAIVTAELGQFERAGWFIVWCVLLDVADGVAARLLKATSSFGAEFDSFADLVAFGLAPAALVLQFVWQSFPDAASAWLIAACAGYALLAALRLARFNTAKPVQAGWFRGVPTTVCGGLVAVGIILLVRHDPLRALNWPVYLPLILTAFGVAMISNLWFPKVSLARSRLLNVPHVANITGVYICGALRIWPEYLFASAVFMIALGITMGLLRRPPR